MANHKSARKRARQNVKRYAVNKRAKSAVRTWEKKLRAAISSSKKDEALNLFQTFMSQLDKAAQKGIFKRETADRKKSRLSKQISQLG